MLHNVDQAWPLSLQQKWYRLVKQTLVIDHVSSAEVILSHQQTLVLSNQQTLVMSLQRRSAPAPSTDIGPVPSADIGPVSSRDMGPVTSTDIDPVPAANIDHVSSINRHLSCPISRSDLVPSKGIGPAPSQVICLSRNRQMMQAKFQISHKFSTHSFVSSQARAGMSPHQPSHATSEAASFK